MFDQKTLALAETVLRECRSRGWRIATAESCTGGLVAAALTAIPGASAVVERGFVVYSNDAKKELLGVTQATLTTHGAVSAEAASAMATGAIERAKVDLAVAIVGVAGPDGGSPEKPVGLVHFAIATRNGQRTQRQIFPGNRTEVRQAALVFALQSLIAGARGI